MSEIHGRATVFKITRCMFLRNIHVFLRNGLVLRQPLLKSKYAFIFWELKCKREIRKCSFCKHKRSGPCLKGKFSTTKGFRSIPGVFLRSGRTPSVAWK